MSESEVKHRDTRAKDTDTEKSYAGSDDENYKSFSERSMLKDSQKTKKHSHNDRDTIDESRREEVSRRSNYFIGGHLTEKTKRKEGSWASEYASSYGESSDKKESEKNRERKHYPSVIELTDGRSDESIRERRHLPLYKALIDGTNNEERYRRQRKHSTSDREMADESRRGKGIETIEEKTHLPFGGKLADEIRKEEDNNPQLHSQSIKELTDGTINKRGSNRRKSSRGKVPYGRTRNVDYSKEGKYSPSDIQITGKIKKEKSSRERRETEIRYDSSFSESKRSLERRIREEEKERADSFKNGKRFKIEKGTDTETDANVGPFPPENTVIIASEVGQNDEEDIHKPIYRMELVRNFSESTSKTIPF